MKISTILDRIDTGSMALPVFQRGYVWNRDQVRALFTSLYHDYPVGALLIWETSAQEVDLRGKNNRRSGAIELLLDGQQRMTSIYGVARGREPAFFEGDPKAFHGLWFHLGTQEFRFYQPRTMGNDPLWLDVSAVMKGGLDGIEAHAKRVRSADVLDVGAIYSRINKLLLIIQRDVPEQKVTHRDANTVVEIFNRVNSRGTKLSKGDLAMAKISVDWPEARDHMNEHLHRWSDRYSVGRDWLLRSVNTVLTGEADFKFLHDKNRDEIKEGLERAVKSIETALNFIDSRLGLDHDRVFFGKYAMPVMARYLDRRREPLASDEVDKLLFWFVQAAMWGRFSGSTETTLDRDLESIEDLDGGLDRLIEQLRLWRGGLRVEPAHFDGHRVSARFYPMLYMLTRMSGAKDLCEPYGELKAGMLGMQSKLELHHIFPKKVLYDAGYNKTEVSALANFCFLTKQCNLRIGAKPPTEYMPECSSNALQSQWIPTDPELWRTENYRDFLAARRELLAAEANRVLARLLHGDSRLLEGAHVPRVPGAAGNFATVLGGIESEEERSRLEEVSRWMRAQGLAPGEIGHSLDDKETGTQRAVLDLAWPWGVQEGLREPVALVLNEGPELVALASVAGYRCFTSEEDFKHYVEHEVLSGAEPPTGSFG